MYVYLLITSQLITQYDIVTTLGYLRTVSEYKPPSSHGKENKKKSREHQPETPPKHIFVGPRCRVLWCILQSPPPLPSSRPYRETAWVSTVAPPPPPTPSHWQPVSGPSDRYGHRAVRCRGAGRRHPGPTARQFDYSRSAWWPGGRLRSPQPRLF